MVLELPGECPMLVTIVRGLGLRTGDVGIGEELGVLARGESGM